MRFLAFIFLMFFLANGSFVAFAVESDTISLPEVTVTANLLEGQLKTVAGSLSLLTEDQLEHQDPIAINNQLNRLPGVFMHSGTFNTNRIIIRGIGSRTPYSSNRVKAYLNDIPLTNGDGVSTLEDIDVSRLGRIEVMKGPSSALYGSGLGGVIHLKTNQRSTFLEAKSQLGSFNTRLFGIQSGIQKENKSLSFSLHRTHSDGFRENNQFNRSSGFLTANRQWDKLDISLTAILVQMEAEIPSSINEEMFLNSPEKAAPNWLAAGGYEENTRLILGTSMKYRFSEKSTNKLTLFGGTSNSFEHRPFNDLKDQSATFGLRNQLKLHLNKMDVLAGVELFQEHYQWQTQKEELLLTDLIENRRYANLFGLVHYRPLNALQLTAGININRLHYTYRSNSKDSGAYSYPIIVSPRVGANFLFSDNITFYGSLGHGFSTPSLEETLLPAGEKNPDIKPEQGWMYEAGVRYHTSDRRLFIDATVYSIALNNLLVTKRISEEHFLGINAGKTKHSGIELQANYTILDLPKFPGSISASTAITVSKNLFLEFIDKEVDFSGKNLPGIPAQTANTSLNWKPLSNFQINFTHFYFGKQFLNDSNDLNHSARQLIHLNGSYLFSKNANFSIKLAGGVNNLLNEKYASMLLVNAPSFGGNAPRYYYPGQKRNYYLSLALIF